MIRQMEKPMTEKHAIDPNTRHATKMAKKKAARDKIMAGKTDEKGLIIVHTGKGKGKSTAGFGMIFRSLGHGHKVAIVQFVKGRIDTGERLALGRFDDLVTLKRMGDGFTWETQDRQRDIAAAKEAWEMAKELISSREHRIVLLDELNIVLRYDYLDINEVVDFLKNEKPDDVHVIITGRNAKEELIDIADLVTEMTQIKHPFRSGVKPQEGIEF
jgi:cob(I)alamin adenosyltransferase